MRAAIYARVSSQQQREAQTIESQLRVLPEFVRARGWTLVGKYVDDGRSAKAGKLAKRTGLAELLADAAAGKFDVVVVIDMDRITRSEDITERGAILGAFQRAGVQLAIASSGQVLDLRSSMGDLYSALQGFFAAEENRKRSERCKRGRAQAIERGRLPSGAAPYGYRRNAATGTIEPDPVEAPIVREMYARAARGESAAAIGRDLIARGIGPRRGGVWSSNVARLLSETTYRGELVVSEGTGAWIPCVPLVEPDVWHLANGQVQAGTLRGLDRTRHVYLVQGLVDCGVCGAPLQIRAESRRLARDRSPYLQCRTRRLRTPGTACTMPMIQIGHVEAAVWEALTRWIEQPELIAQLSGRAAGAVEASTWTDDVADFRRQFEELQVSESAIVERFARGLISAPTMDTTLQRIAARRAFLGQQIAGAERAAAGAVATRVALADAAATLEQLRAGLRTEDREIRQRLVRALVPGWGPYRIVVRADRSVEIGVVLEAAGLGSGSIGSDPCDRASERGQVEGPQQGRIAVVLRAVAGGRR